MGLPAGSVSHRKGRVFRGNSVLQQSGEMKRMKSGCVGDGAAVFVFAQKRVTVSLHCATINSQPAWCMVHGSKRWAVSSSDR